MVQISAEDYNWVDPENWDFGSCDTVLHPEMPIAHDDLVAAIRATESQVSSMMRLLGRSRAAIMRAISSSEAVQEIFGEYREYVVDTVEAGVLKKAMAGDGPSERFVLTTLGKNRGYSQRVESTGPNGGPVETVQRLDASGLSNDERADFKRLLLAAKGIRNEDDEE